LVGKTTSMRRLILRTLVTSSGVNVLGLVNSVLLARSLAPEGRGALAAAFLWPGLLVYLCSMGLIVATMYFSSLPNSDPRVVLNNAFLMGLILSAAALPVGYLIVPWLLKSQAPQVIKASQWYLLVIPLSLLTQLGLGVLQGRLRMVELNWLRLLVPLGYLLGTLSFLWLGQLTVDNIVGLHLGLNFAALLATLVALGRLRIYLGLETDVGLMREMLWYGLRTHVGQVSGLANLSLDQALIAAWLAPAYLGLYVVAVSSAGLLQMLSGAVQQVSMPSIAQKESSDESRSLLRLVFRRYWIISILVMLVIAAALPVIVPFVFGDRFRPAVWPAEVLLLASLFKGAEQVLGGGAGALGNPWLGSKANMTALVVTVGLLYALLPRLGLMGAAIASAAAYLVELLVVLYGLHHAHAISPLSLFRGSRADLAEAELH
jgi:O-antigen/teichoic acid export membrane protein